MVRDVVLAVALAGAGWAAAGAVDAAVLCEKKSGAVFVRETCKKKETAVDVTALLGTLPSRVARLESTATMLQAGIGAQLETLSALQAAALTKSSIGTVAGYATVDSDGTLVESYSSAIAAVMSSRTQQGAYSVSFGFQVRPDQPIVAVPRETSGHEICRVSLGSSAVNGVSVFCADADAGSPAADVAFTLVVFH